MKDVIIVFVGLLRWLAHSSEKEVMLMAETLVSIAYLIAIIELIRAIKK